MIPTFDKALVVFIAGLVLSFLEMNGLADSSQHSQNIDALQQVVGGLIFAISITAWVVQHVILVKHSTPAGQPMQEAKFSFQPLLTFLTTVFKSPKTQNVNAVVVEPQP